MMLLVLEVEADSFISAGISSALDFRCQGSSRRLHGLVASRILLSGAMMPGDSREQLAPVA